MFFYHALEVVEVSGDDVSGVGDLGGDPVGFYFSHDDNPGDFAFGFDFDFGGVEDGDGAEESFDVGGDAEFFSGSVAAEEFEDDLVGAEVGVAVSAACFGVAVG